MNDTKRIATPPKPFAIGEPVTAIGFDTPVIGLTVKSVTLNPPITLLRPHSIQPYYRIEAMDANGVVRFEGSARFFESAIGHEIMERVTDGVIRDMEGGAI